MPAARWGRNGEGQPRDNTSREAHLTPRILIRRILGTLRPGRPKAYKGLRGVGQDWERLAERHLKAEGYTIRDRNFRARAGEVDFIAEENGVLCFIEVKGRSGPGFGSPAAAVTLEKQRRIFRSAEEYLKRKRLGSPPCRFDVVSVLEAEGAAEVRILRGAFSEPPPRPRRG